MIGDVKKELLSRPDAIVSLLEHYGFAHIQQRDSELRFAIDDQGNATGIRIKLRQNDNLYVNDFVRNINRDIFSYIIQVKNVTFTDIFHWIKSFLGIEYYANTVSQRIAFGGFYNRIHNQVSDIIPRVLQECVLCDYLPLLNLRFIKDNISAQTQREFQIGYDVESQRITIPIRNFFGELIGVKGRAAWNVQDDEPKYIYLQPCPTSSTLFGYCQNYDCLKDGESILIGESEKFVLQCRSYGLRNAVALGGNSISDMQCKSLVELQPKKIIFMLDRDLDLGVTAQNINKIKTYTRMFDIELYYWDWTLDSDLPSKASPSDGGRILLKKILKEQVKQWTTE